ncbi:MAG: UvrB/UvrC motif-containing protein [Bdellovibrionaceae bacterium]|nr:UvrB/UvrC motif-containing protein [Pseudobdellovibrionaceae bacterium]
MGINLLREGLDLPEVALVAILDADKEGFLRSERSLIQTIGRAARNINGRVILYADVITESMQKAIMETERRRKIQSEYNKVHGITPQSVKKKIREGLGEIYDGTLNVLSLSEKSKAQKQLAKYSSDPTQIQSEIEKLRQKMKRLSEALEFEEAAKVRDEIKRLQLLDLSLRSGETERETGRVIENDFKSV